ncbi:hypothetical protein HNP46_006056 [Pseudomonas nitritireducens]|uniref:Uncharacterized protein n=1 Tax=Pseudomonas nitroreducens TaxID=46680 RepID=A0A7W7KQJ2_PSENT|nr:hypothetical protein [Pseudomonas nitritireducens]MBB4867145.1 hypothetical protein [Pseudomonas nitritireducens]
MHAEDEIDLEWLSDLAWRFHQALKAAHSEGNDGLLGASGGDFPEGLCGHASLAFGRYLMVEYGVEAMRISATHPEKGTHEWLAIKGSFLELRDAEDWEYWVMTNGVIVDLTHGQFDRQSRPMVFVGSPDGWFDQWVIDQPPDAPAKDLRIPDDLLNAILKHLKASRV